VHIFSDMGSFHVAPPALNMLLLRPWSAYFHVMMKLLLL